MYLNHFDIQQKGTQHCNSTILQLKKNILIRKSCLVREDGRTVSWARGLGCQCPYGVRRRLLSLQAPWRQDLAWCIRAGVQASGSPDMSMHSSPVYVMRRSQMCARKDREISEKRTQQVLRPWDGDQAW